MELNGIRRWGDNDDYSEGIIIRMHVSQISKTGRVTQGVKLMNLSEEEKVVSIAKVMEE